MELIQTTEEYIYFIAGDSNSPLECLKLSPLTFDINIVYLIMFTF
jgi:hypothetical protein